MQWKLSNDKVAAAAPTTTAPPAEPEAATGNSKCVGFTRLRSVLLFGARTSVYVSRWLYSVTAARNTECTICFSLSVAEMREARKNPEQLETEKKLQLSVN